MRSYIAFLALPASPCLSIVPRDPVTKIGGALSAEAAAGGEDIATRPCDMVCGIGCAAGPIKHIGHIGAVRTQWPWRRQGH